MKVLTVYSTVICALFLVACASRDQAPSVLDTAKALPCEDVAVPASASTLYTIVGTGDILMGLNYPENAPRYARDDGAHLFDSVRDILLRADVAFGNLEGVLLDTGGIPKKRYDSTKACFWFRSPERYAQHLVNAGFDVMSVANNHVCDFGREARQNTLSVLDKAGLLYAGSLNRKSVVYEKDGIRYGFCAFSAMPDCPSLLDEASAKSLIQELRLQCDVLIVSFHGGQEGKDATHVPFKSEYGRAGAVGDVHHFAHACIDAGADIIFGHGPHVARAVELYKDRFIAYSLGNFCTPFGMVISGVSGLAPMIEVSVDKTGQFHHAQIYAAYQRWGVGPRMDPQKRVVDEIRRLSQEDFPDSPLRIDANGLVERMKR